MPIRAAMLDPDRGIPSFASLHPPHLPGKSMAPPFRQGRVAEMLPSQIRDGQCPPSFAPIWVNQRYSAMFCLYCGNIIYHDSKSITQPKKQILQRHRLLFSAILFGTVATLIVVLSVSRSGVLKPNVVNTATETPPKTFPVGAPVLTVIA